MEIPKNKLSDGASIFFKNLEKYINKPIFFYGSIQRNDYIQGKSDIDVDIFTDNEASTINKIMHYLKVPREKFKRIIWNIRNTDIVVTGYKLTYKIPKIKFPVEFSIYSEKFKDVVLPQHIGKMTIPFVASILLYILKTIYYKLNLINQQTFRYLKIKILNTSLGLTGEDLFAVI
jgi:hypothetical protein